MSWVQQDASGDVLLWLHVQPGARKTEVVGLHGGALKIRLAAPPVDGKANACLVDFIAGRIGVPRVNVELVSGATSRRKRLRVSGVTIDKAERLLA